MDVLYALQQLLSTPGFIAVISGLLHHDNSLVRKEAMQLFYERLQKTLLPGETLLVIHMPDVILQNLKGTEKSVDI